MAALGTGWSAEEKDLRGQLTGSCKSSSRGLSSAGTVHTWHMQILRNKSSLQQEEDAER